MKQIMYLGDEVSSVPQDEASSVSQTWSQLCVSEIMFRASKWSKFCAPNKASSVLQDEESSVPQDGASSVLLSETQRAIKLQEAVFSLDPGVYS